MANSFSASPIQIPQSILKNRGLLVALAWHDFRRRYSGSLLGVTWSFLNPIFMLAIYTFVFSIALKARWGSAEESQVSYSLIIFSGMIIHSFFAECLNSAPFLIVTRQNFVKKVFFPLEILPCIAVLTALLNFAISFCILLVFCLFSGLQLQLSIVFVPVVMLPLILTTLGATWLLSALGVYFRDLSQGIIILTTVLIFMAPVFYSLESLPERYKMLINLNPITMPIIQLREILLWQHPIDWTNWGISLATGLCACSIGFFLFQKVRKGFADVI